MEYSAGNGMPVTQKPVCGNQLLLLLEKRIWSADGASSEIVAVIFEDEGKVSGGRSDNSGKDLGGALMSVTFQHIEGYTYQSGGRKSLCNIPVNNRPSVSPEIKPRLHFFNPKLRFHFFEFTEAGSEFFIQKIKKVLWQLGRSLINLFLHVL